MRISDWSSDVCSSDLDNSAGTKLDLDVGYQTSRSKDKDVRTAVGNRIPELMLDTDDDGGARPTVPNAYLIDRTGVSFPNQPIQDFGDARGSLFPARLAGEQAIGGFLSSFTAGLRSAKRTAPFYNVHINPPTPFVKPG